MTDDVPSQADLALLARLQRQRLTWSEASSRHGHFLERLRDFGLVERQIVPHSRIGLSYCVPSGENYNGR